ncbi:MAG: hypothetical protein U0T83_10230 [Bacteriovoracaceae bacterium]
MATIFGRSQHPVIIKKIKINIWTLRDEIKALMASRIHNEKERGNSVIEISDIIKVYSPNNNVNTANAANIAEAPLPDVPLDNSEDEMKKALEEEARLKNGEAPTPEAAPEEVSTAASPVDAEKNNEGKITEDMYLLKRYPQLSDDKVSTGVAILYDITFDKIHIFSTRNFIAGQSIVIEFLIPDPFCITIEVLHCVKYNPSSRIISENKPSFRIIGKFLFMKKGERTQLRRFLQSIDANPANNPNNGADDESTGAEGEEDVASLLKEM